MAVIGSELTDRQPEVRSGNRDGMIGMLADPNLRRLWAAQTWSAAGESLAMIALPLLVYDISGSARMVGLIALLLSLPRVIMAPIAGLLIDRFDRRRLMIASDVGRLALVVFLPLADSVAQVGVLAVGISIGNAIARPAELAVVPSVAGQERLVRALSLMQVTNGIVRVAVPAAGAGIIATIGPGPAFWLQGACFAFSLSSLRRLVIPPLTDESPEALAANLGLLRQAKAEIGAGLRAVRDTPIVRGITGTEALWQLVAGVLVVTAVVYTQETLDLGNRANAAFALLTTSMSAGAVTGALLAHRLERRLGRPTLLAIGYTAPGFLIFAFFTPPMPLLYAFWFLLGLTDAWAVISFQAYLAEQVPDRLRGRVYSAFGATIALAGAASYYLMGVVTPWLGAPRTFAAVGLIVGIGGPIILWLSGALESIRRPAPHPPEIAPIAID
jgi:MFS family permease